MELQLSPPRPEMGECSCPVRASPKYDAATLKNLKQGHEYKESLKMPWSGYIQINFSGLP